MFNYRLTFLDNNGSLCLIPLDVNAFSKKYFPINTYYLLGIDIDESDKNITFVNTAIIKKCSNYLTKLKSALDTFKMMVKRNMIDMD